ncbi:hypothetical protein [uncultured Sphaerochaeta sp.]|uniref:hypothetical protein n=1 Tax=uncultured Sphaerochaeta sp. TaxID=886478 RepID=UPI002A0A3277|nr:hypothetical protein [uncultured Sphaerochaeta sp.]
MKKRYYLFALLLLLAPLSFMGCQTYTQKVAKTHIDPIPSLPTTTPLVTRYSVIEAQKKATQDALLAKQAEQKEKEAATQKALQEQQKIKQEALQAQEAEAQAQEEALQEENAKKATQATIDALTKENQTLQTQLMEKERTLAQIHQTEQQKLTETKLQQEAKQQAEQQKAKEAADAEAKLQLKLEQEKQAREAEIRKIPPLDQITFPRFYDSDKPSLLAQNGEQLNALIIPLADTPWTDTALAAEVAKSIDDLKVPVIFLTGNMENVIALVRQLHSDATLFADGAIVSDFAVVSTSENGVVVQYSKGKTVQLSLINLPQYSVLQAFKSGSDWKAVEKEIAPERIKKVEQVIKEGENTLPTIVGASLYEPSYQDWNTFSPISYRQVEYHWPLSQTFEQEGFYDTYRLTHFNEATNAGNTLKIQDMEERIDYLFTRKVLPLQSSIITLGPESLPDNEISRYGLYGSYLIP